jgi:Zn-finger nucleic acid-binding protein
MPRGEPLRCPNDDSRLVELDRAGVLIDACPECRGVWLDRGELDKILVKERQLSMTSGAADDDFFEEMEGRRRSEPGQVPAPDDRRFEKKRRRRSVLEDLLDFD